MKKLTFGMIDRLKQLHQLTSYRNEFIKKEGSYPEFRIACQKTGIAPQKLKCLPNLAEKWNDVGYPQ